MVLTLLKYTRAYPQTRGTGTRYAAVCRNLLPYPYPRYPFWKHRGFFRTRAKPYVTGRGSDAAGLILIDLNI